MPGRDLCAVGEQYTTRRSSISVDCYGQAERLVECRPVTNHVERLGHEFESLGNIPLALSAEGATSPCSLYDTGELEQTSGKGVSIPYADSSSASVSNLTTSNVRKGPRGYLRIGLLNVNSINDAKFDFLVKRMEKAYCAFSVITELSSDSSDTIYLLEKHPKYPILACPKNRRVGLMIPRLWWEHVEIVDTWSRVEKRQRKSQIAIQCTTYRITLSTFVCTISAVYIVPDASIEAKKTLFEHKVGLQMKYPNYMSLGDYNMDATQKKNREFFKSHCGGCLSQLVKGITREKTRTLNGKSCTSKTMIDLVFVSPEIKSKIVSKVDIITTTPSDHYMVEICLDIKVPLKYAVKEYFLDPTRRPPIPKDKLETVRFEIRHTLEEAEKHMRSLTQVQHMNFIGAVVKTVLDRYNPLNKPEKLTKRIYRFTVSKETKTVMSLARKARDAWRVACRRQLHCSLVESRYAQYKALRNKKNCMVKYEKNTQQSNKIYSGVRNAKCVWDILRKFFRDPHYTPPRQRIRIKGKTGIELADHMANFCLERALLVTDEEATVCSEYIPFNCIEWPETIDINDNIEHDVKELFVGKKKPTLAAGPDTVSHRHLSDLMPVLENQLQLAIGKPLIEFSSIQQNFVRLLAKEKPTLNSELTEKSQRPITELNVLPKYGSIKVFVNQLRDQITKRMNSNQFAFPGKGGPLATAKVLDFVNLHASSGKKVLLVTWDFSNAFCTTIHEITVKIAQRYNLSDRVTKLLSQFLEQTYSVIKIADSKGCYRSSELDLIRGTPQGQLGSDFIFAMINDNINPEQILNEIILRVKYVDDFNDVIVDDTVQGVFDSLHHNEDLLKKQATSVGLKLNMDKLNIIPLNIPKSEYDPEYLTRGPNGKSVYTDSIRLLDFQACAVHPLSLEMCISSSESEGPNVATANLPDLRRSKKSQYSKLSGEPAGQMLIARLNEAIKTISTLRKFETNIEKKVSAATALVWSNIYDLGLVYAYCGEKSHIWQQICISVKRLLKSAGLDYMMNSMILYKTTLKMDMLSIAKKQIIQAGIKMVNQDDFNVRSYRIKRVYGDEKSPFRYTFLCEFNTLPQDIRKTIFENINALDQSNMAKIKGRLKRYYIYTFDPECPAYTISKEKRRALLDKNLYSQAKIQKRKRAADIAKSAKLAAQELRDKRVRRKLLTTPKQPKAANSTSSQTPAVIRRHILCRAPMLVNTSCRRQKSVIM